LLFVVIGRAVPPLLLAGAVLLPYHKDAHWRRALVTDLLVAIVTAAFVRLAAGTL
jgi:hypothetical protein